MPNQEAPRVIQTLGPTAQGFSFALEEFEGRVQLRALHRSNYGPISADWSNAEMSRRIAGGRKQLLSRALGLHKNNSLRILDATAGMGRDGFTLAALGARVTMVERQSLILELIKDAHKRATCSDRLAPIAQRVEILGTDATLLFSGGPWDAIYLDPMYPETDKTALPQKEMQIFRELTAGDPDAGTLIAAATQITGMRVVVKRPSKAPWLSKEKPTFSLHGSQIRYDVYMINHQHLQGGL